MKSYFNALGCSIYFNQGKKSSLDSGKGFSVRCGLRQEGHETQALRLSCGYLWPVHVEVATRKIF